MTINGIELNAKPALWPFIESLIANSQYYQGCLCQFNIALLLPFCLVAVHSSDALVIRGAAHSAAGGHLAFIALK